MNRMRGKSAVISRAALSRDPVMIVWPPAE